MSQSAFMDFLIAVRDNSAMLARYDGRDLGQLLFHARTEGYAFSAADVAEVMGKLEASVILNKDRSAFDGTSPLWRQMWGRRHLAYAVEAVVRRHTDDELRAMVAPTEQPIA
jgi:hypothetical protein